MSAGAGDEAIGIDVGGTKILGVRVDAGGSPLARERRPTPYGSWEDLVAAVVGVARALLTPRVAAVGVGLPGLVDTHGTLAFAPRPPISHAPVRRRVEEALGLRIHADNDVNAAVWGEHRLGAAQGHHDVVMVALGTGVGAGVLTGGRILRGAHGFAGEIWRLPVKRGAGGGDRPVVRLGDAISGRELTRLGQEAARRSPDSALATLAGDPSRVTGELVTQAAQEGDETAVSVLAGIGELLGRGIAHLVELFDPSLVVVGGSLSSAGDLLLDPTRRNFRSASFAWPGRPGVPVVPAALGNEAGAIGAACLALDPDIA